MRKICGLLAIVLIPAAFVGAEEDNAGRVKEPAAFLNLGLGARALGMGKAYTAVANDASAAYWNPAGLAQLERYELQGTSGSLGYDRRLYFLGLGIPLHVFWENTTIEDLEFKEDRKKYGMWLPLSDWKLSVAFGSAIYGVNDIDRRNDLGVKQGEFSDREYVYFFSVGHDVLRDLSFGYTYHYHTQRIDESNAKGGGFDCAVHIHPAFIPGFNLGASFVNVGGAELSWKAMDEVGITNEYEEEMPRRIKAGTSYRLARPDILLALDAEMVRNQKPVYRGGVEFRPFKPMALRAGADGKTPSIGAGFTQRFGRRLNLDADYAFVLGTEKLGETHRFTLITRF